MGCMRAAAVREGLVRGGPCALYGEGCVSTQQNSRPCTGRRYGEAVHEGRGHMRRHTAYVPHTPPYTPHTPLHAAVLSLITPANPKATPP